jgi:hypothetical protein
MIMETKSRDPFKQTDNKIPELQFNSDPKIILSSRVLGSTKVALDLSFPRSTSEKTLIDWSIKNGYKIDGLVNTSVSKPTAAGVSISFSTPESLQRFVDKAIGLGLSHIAFNTLKKISKQDSNLSLTTSGNIPNLKDVTSLYPEEMAFKKPKLVVEILSMSKVDNYSFSTTKAPAYILKALLPDGKVMNWAVPTNHTELKELVQSLGNSIKSMPEELVKKIDLIRIDPGTLSGKVFNTEKGEIENITASGYYIASQRSISVSSSGNTKYVPGGNLIVHEFAHSFHSNFDEWLIRKGYPSNLFLLVWKQEKGNLKMPNGVKDDYGEKNENEGFANTMATILSSDPEISKKNTPGLYFLATSFLQDVAKNKQNFPRPQSKIPDSVKKYIK